MTTREHPKRSGYRKINVFEAQLFPDGAVLPRLHTGELSDPVVDFIGRERIEHYLSRCAATEQAIQEAYEATTDIDDLNEVARVVTSTIVGAVGDQWAIHNLLIAKELATMTAADELARPDAAAHYARVLLQRGYNYDPAIDDVSNEALRDFGEFSDPYRRSGFVNNTMVSNPGKYVKQLVEARAEVDMHIASSAVGIGITAVSLLLDHLQSPEVIRGLPHKAQDQITQAAAQLGGLDVRWASGSPYHAKSIAEIDQPLFAIPDIMQQLPLDSLPMSLRQPLSKLDQLVLEALALRRASQVYDLHTEEPTTYNYHPSNTTIAPSVRTSQLALKPAAATPEDLAAMQQRAAEAKAARAAQAAAKRLAEQQAQAELNESERPKIEALNALAGQHNQLLQPFYGQTSKALRADGITGNNSLQYRLSNSLRAVDTGEIDSMIKTYHGLLTISREADSPLDALANTLTEVDRLAGEYREQIREAQLKGKVRPDALAANPRADFLLLKKHWPSIKPIITDPKCAHQLAPGQLEIIEQMLGLREIIAKPAEQPAPLIKTAANSNEAPVAAKRSPLEIANAQAEKLDFVLLPKGTTAEELVDIATEARAKRGETSEREIEPYRMQVLLDFCDTFDAELMQSAERILGDSDDLYFIITFTDDKKRYAILENPVKGNATYILREDLLPLLPGETVLTAARHTPRDVMRACGAERLYHPDNRNNTRSDTELTEVHTDAIFDRLSRLQAQKPLA